MLWYLLQITLVMHIDIRQLSCFDTISLTHAFPLELLCQINCCSVMVSAKKKWAQRQRKYKDAANVYMKEYYENNKKCNKTKPKQLMNRIRMLNH